VVTNEQITDLENLTLGQERDNVKQWHWKSPINVDISLFWNQIIASVNQYSATDVASLKAKLAQFPRGTKFLVNISGSPQFNYHWSLNGFGLPDAVLQKMYCTNAEKLLMSRTTQPA
jgi:hypothetical protein